MAGQAVRPETAPGKGVQRCFRAAVRNWARTVCSAFVGVAILSVVFCCDPALGGGGPRNVLLVINRASETSRTVGAHYRAVRNIPSSNICYITCSTAECVTKTECEAQIREPIRQFILSNGLDDIIDYIVLTKGVPVTANYGHPSGSYSVTSILTCATEPTYQGPFLNPYGPRASSSWETPAPETAWSHRLAFRVKGSDPAIYRRFFLVTRLDGYSAVLVNQMIDRSVAPALDGRFVVDRDPSRDWNVTYQLMNVRLGEAADLLTARGFDTLQDNSSAFLGGVCGLMGYFSWGSNEWSYKWSLYASNTFVPGGIADTYVSSSGRTFNSPANWPNYSGQSLIADLLLSGLCGAAGYVSEPTGGLTSYADTLFDRYTEGFNMAESFYAACPEFLWKLTVVGDPLMAPFATPPIVAILNPGATVTGVATVQAEAVDEGPVARVDFYLDERFIGSDTKVPYSVAFDTRSYSVGPHTVEAIAYEDSPVGTQGSATATVNIANEVSPCDRISQVLSYKDGQVVRLGGKVVTSAEGSIPGVFYAEEADRSSAIRVSCTGVAVAEGSVVDVQGPVSVVGAEKTIVSPSVTITGSAQVPTPLAMNLPTMVAGGSDTGERCGTRTTGLLVSTVGRVAAVENGVLALDAGPGSPTVRVKCSQSLQAAAGKWISVVGIFSTAESGPGQILVRKPSDMTVIR